ncbi:uncharacterized protein LOC127728997, partial [Mytilus californianus]|uniref:uncharacterized protein LOC127728997 n=1 Tax=Mytilus californianus TaxID=6549 RepID=UPI00224501E5
CRQQYPIYLKGEPSAIFVNSFPKNNGALCPVFKGGFGNHIFQFAYTFGIAKSKNMNILVNEKVNVSIVFKLTVDVRNDSSDCNGFMTRIEKFTAKYDDNLLNFNPEKSFRVQNALQSWKCLHIRRGDMVNMGDNSFNVASLEYLTSAVNYFKDRYQNIIFIVASNGMSWAQRNMPSNISVEFIQHSAVADMVTLATCNHTMAYFGWIGL